MSDIDEVKDTTAEERALASGENTTPVKSYLDGRQGWMVCAAAFVLLLNSSGQAYAIG